MKKNKKVIIGVIIGILAFPTITLGGTFISSLIQGKTVDEAVQILATQLDSLIGRVKILENRQNNDEFCREANRLLYLIPPHEPDSDTGKYFGRPEFPHSIIDLYERIVKGINDGQNYNPEGEGVPIIEPIVEEYYQNYLLAEEKCK